jgi:hypothetical protein
MKAHYRAFNGRLVVEVEGSNIKELFQQIGPVAEVLDGDDSCGKCASPHIYPRVRTAQGFDYYELVCSDCNARLSFGQHKDGGTLWAKRTGENGRVLDHRGWSVYLALEPGEKKHDPPASAPRPTTAPPQQQTIKEQNEFAMRSAQLLKRTMTTADTTQMHGELCDALEGISGDKECANRVWAEALKKHGDPLKLPSAVRPVTEHLLRTLMEFEKLKQGAA